MDRLANDAQEATGEVGDHNDDDQCSVSTDRGRDSFGYRGACSDDNGAYNVCRAGGQHVRSCCGGLYGVACIARVVDGSDC